MSDIPALVRFTLLAAAAATIQVGTRAQVAEQPRFGAVVPAQAETVDLLGKRIEGRQGARSVASAAWHVLALSANGSGMRYGAHKQGIKILMVALRNGQDQQGYFGTRQGRANRFDHMLASLAMLHEHIEAHYMLLRKYTVRGIEATLEDIERVDAPPTTAAEALLLAILAERMLQLPKPEPVLQERLAGGARRALAGQMIGKSRATDAAVHLGRFLLGDNLPAELLIAQCMPANLSADPWHTFIGAYALRRVDEHARKTQWPAVQRLLAKRGVDGLWPAATAAEAHTVSAALATSVALLYVPPSKDRVGRDK